jgi:hypothetical protein
MHVKPCHPTTVATLQQTLRGKYRRIRISISDEIFDINCPKISRDSQKKARSKPQRAFFVSLPNLITQLRFSVHRAVLSRFGFLRRPKGALLPMVHCSEPAKSVKAPSNYAAGAPSSYVAAARNKLAVAQNSRVARVRSSYAEEAPNSYVAAARNKFAVAQSIPVGVPNNFGPVRSMSVGKARRRGHYKCARYTQTAVAT